MKIKKQTQKTRLTSIRYGWLVVMVSLGLFTSCSKNEDANKLPYGKYPIAVMAEVDGQVLTRVAGKDAWANDDVMAMKIGDVTKKYIFNATTGKFSCADPFYWGSSTEKMTVDAWYPYSDVKTADVDIRVKADQSTEANYLESDLLEVDGGVISLVNDKVTFRHRTSKVVINLTAKQGIDISTVGVAITNLSGVETGTDVKPHKNGNTYTALLVPQNSSGKGFIKVTFKGVDYTYIPKTNEASFTAGKQYTYNIAVDITGLTVTVNGATLWEQEGGVNNVQSAISVKVGDCYHSDGTVSTYTEASKADKTIIGVVFQVGLGHGDASKSGLQSVNGYVLALNRANKNSTMDDVPVGVLACEYVNKPIPNTVSEDVTLDNGYDNTQAMKAANDYNYPALRAAIYYDIWSTPKSSSGWFLPSINQLKTIYKNKETLSNMIPNLLEPGSSYTGHTYSSTRSFGGLFDIDFMGNDDLQRHDGTAYKFAVRAILAF